MSASIQVIDLEGATLCVECIFVNASGELRAKVSGVECGIATKPALVEAGLVVVQPLDFHLAQQRPVFNQLNVSKSAGQFWCVAADQRLVNAAQRFNALRASGHAVPEQQIWPIASQE